MDGQPPTWAVAPPPPPAMQQPQHQFPPQQAPRPPPQLQQQPRPGGYPTGTPPPIPVPAGAPPRKPQRPSIEQSALVTRTPDEETEDGRIRNLEAVTKIRDAWIYKQIRARQDEFTQYKHVSLHCNDPF